MQTITKPAAVENSKKIRCFVAGNVGNVEMDDDCHKLSLPRRGQAALRGSECVSSDIIERVAMPLSPISFIGHETRSTPSGSVVRYRNGGGDQRRRAVGVLIGTRARPNKSNERWPAPVVSVGIHTFACARSDTAAWLPRD